MPAEAILEILFMYLKSTLVGCKAGIYPQKYGICIGSKVAPILSDLCISKINKRIEDTLGNCIKVFWYIDDCLIFCSGDDFESVVTSVS